MQNEVQKIYVGPLLIILSIYCLASLIHFVHNAVFIEYYPNLPDWITKLGVYVTWLGITSIGIAGYLLFSYGKIYLGLVLCAVYGAIGLDGLGHYSFAPISEHTFMMNSTIWLEAATGILVVVFVIKLMVKSYNERSQSIAG